MNQYIISLLTCPEDLVFLKDITTESKLVELPKSLNLSEGSQELFKCSICPSEETSYSVFTLSGEKRIHFSSEWHKFNIKRSHQGHTELLTLYEYDSLTEDGLNALLEEPVVGVGEIVEEFPTPPSREVLTLFSLKGHPSIKCQVYTEILDPKELKKGVIIPERRDLLFSLLMKPQAWMIVMLASGRFYYSIYENISGSCIKHGSIKTYVGRQKQGGSQLIRDKKSPVARSAGSQLRRENERKWIRALESTVESLKAEGFLERCSLIFQSCSIYYQSRLFCLLENTEKIRRIPFTTGAPGFKEMERCYKRLSSFETKEDLS